MLLENKNAIIYGAAGGIGGAVATAFASEGATVFLTGRTAARLDALAARIRAAGGTAETAVVDALDETAVDEHAASIGRVDVSMNVITHGDVQGIPMARMSVEDYVRPVATAVRTQFITARAAARQMSAHSGGVILMFGGSGDPARGYHIGGVQTAFHAMEAMRRQLSAELGAAGIRVVTLRTGGIPESLPADEAGREQIIDGIGKATMLGRAASFVDVGRVACFAASDHAASVTAAAINISAGALVD